MPASSEVIRQALNLAIDACHLKEQKLADRKARLLQAIANTDELLKATVKARSKYTDTLGQLGDETEDDGTISLVERESSDEN